MSLGSPGHALRAYLDAINTHDFGNVRKLLHARPVFWFADATCEASDSVQAYFENAWRLVEGEVYTAADVRWIAVGPGVASCVYAYTYEGYHAGAFVRGGGRATNVFATDAGGRWRLVHEHLSPAPG